jgi:hypothetical protein
MMGALECGVAKSMTRLNICHPLKPVVELKAVGHVV